MPNSPNHKGRPTSNVDPNKQTIGDMEQIAVLLDSVLDRRRVLVMKHRAQIFTICEGIKQLLPAWIEKVGKD